MGVSKYVARGKTWWRVDEWLAQPDGKFVGYRKKRIPTKEPAMACAAKVKAESFEGRFFDRVRTPSCTVADLWSAYRPLATSQCAIDARFPTPEAVAPVLRSWSRHLRSEERRVGKECRSR